MVHARGAPERETHQSRHVESRDHGRHRSYDPDDRAPQERLPEDLILAEESRQEWDTCYRQPAAPKDPECDGQMFFQPTHLHHVLLVMQRMYDGARPEKQKRLEEGVRHEMEDGGRKSADTRCEEHVTEL